MVYYCYLEKQPCKMFYSYVPKVVLQLCISTKWSAVCVDCTHKVARLGILPGVCLP